MKLSNRTVYGVRAVVDLAYHGDGEPMRVGQIAERGAIPDHFLQQIFQDLKKAGIVDSKRGPSGGYRLVADPEELTLAELFGVLNGLPRVPEIVEECSEVDTAAKIGDQVCREVVGRVVERLEEITISDLVERGQKQGLARQGYEGFVYVI